MFVVTAVVILVAALVLLTIFGGGIQNVATITQAQSICLSSAQISCSAGGNAAWPPATWDIPNIRIAGGEPKNCRTIMLESALVCNNCDDVAKGCKGLAG
ncbi:MAG: hypothetical protein QW286_00950 [Candidatus Aenigmatarchaeota archaeon]